MIGIIRLNHGYGWLNILISLTILGCIHQESDKSPNILLIITDDQSWEHTGAYGDLAIRTPAIDQLATDGVKFMNAYCAAPSCSPSRAALLTGQDIYRLREGGVLSGFIRKEYPVMPLLLEDAGYFIGHTGKPYWPRTSDIAGAYDNPIGVRYASHRTEHPEGIRPNDYAANFDHFLSEVPENKPFFFWTGMAEPHLPHPTNQGVLQVDTSQIRVPAFYPDVPAIKAAMADYLMEIEWADNMLGKMIDMLTSQNKISNTIIIFTSDNGMPFPRAKATLYDHGVRMPLIMRWDGRIQKGSLENDPISLIDLAPTLLSIVNVPIPDEMTGRDLSGIILQKKGDTKNRDFVVTAFEKHTLARPDSLGFPRRALHTAEWTYVRNYEPDRWPAGNEDVFIPGWDYFGDVDPSSVKTFFMDNKKDPEFQVYFNLSFGKVPSEELYNKVTDPDMIQNLANNPDHAEILAEFRKKLEDYLKSTGDPRMQGLSPWDQYNLDK